MDRSLSIGAIAFDLTDPARQTLVAGSGHFSSIGAGGDRAGVWRTTDGTHWNALTGSGRLTGLNVSGIVPHGSTILLSVDDADSGLSTGIWRSTDSGTSWAPISGTANLPAGRSFDLAADPRDNTRLYTNAGSRGIFLTTNSGGTWAKVSSSAMDALLEPASNVKIAVGLQNNVYVAIVESGVLSGLFRSGNGGASWTALDLPMTLEDGVDVGIHVGAQGNTNLSLAADFTNANVVYIGGDRQPYPTEFSTGECPCFPFVANSIGALDYSGRLFRADASKATGQQTAPITHINTGRNSAPHADSRDMAIDANGHLVEADDGGIYRRADPLSDSGDWSSLNGDLRIAEVHSVAWDANANVVIAGAQDTGTPEQITSAGLRWRSADTGDGGDVGIDDTGTPGFALRYSSAQEFRNFRRRKVDATNNVVDEDFPAHTVVRGRAITTDFVTPIAVNNAVPTRLVIGGANSVYESFDQGDTIAEIGPDIVVNATYADPIAYGGTGNPDILYVGSDDQVFIRSRAGGALVSAPNYPGLRTGRRVMDLAIDTTAPSTAFVVDESTVYRTTGAGSQWSNITGNLLALGSGTLLAVVFRNSDTGGAVIVGSTNGVFVSRGPTFGTWTLLGVGLPRTAVYDLDYDAADHVLVAALVGRGVWVADMREPNPAAPPSQGEVQP
ncbi:MAG: hypothetical protein ABI779_22525 [Acidobacteriota bacterium]